MDKYDFSGWATKNDLKCSDGRTIRKDAFEHNDGQTVPLVWNHQHNDSMNVLGHALLENRTEGVYAYCTFNDTEAGQNAKLLVEHGDVTALSIYANQLKQHGADVLHGMIREVSLVLAGANPGAFIDSVMSHGEESEEEAIIYTDEDIVVEHTVEHNDIEHSDNDKKADENNSDAEKEDVKENSMADGKTVKDVFDTLNEEQKNVVFALISQALEHNDNTDTNEENTEGGDNVMKHNLFDKETEQNQDVISHSDMEAVIGDAKRYGSMRDSALAHGIDNIDYLFPDATNIDNAPVFIKRPDSWVQKFMGSVHHTPFSRIKSMQADITEDDARALGYIKGNLKKEEVFSLMKRTTTPTTIYKKQKLDRDDIIDITDFDIVSWLKTEMRMMLDEEIARACLVGDGRLASSDDKINESNIRPIWTDADLYTIKKTVTVGSSDTDDDKAKAFIKQCIKARKDYRGSGSPTLYTTDDMLTNCLLLTDNDGRDLYESVDKLATKLRVKEIIPVAVMENRTRSVDGKVHTLAGIIVNPTDYNIGADKGGSVNLFDDFDIDYNQQKYLIETRCSGALTVPYSAIAVEFVPQA